jgi:hypothetical protein
VYNSAHRVQLWAVLRVDFNREVTGMYTGVLGAATTTTAAIVLPNTHGNTALAVTAVISLTVGVVAIVTSAARLVAKKAHKA